MTFPQAPSEVEKTHVNRRKSDKKRNILTVYLTLNYSNGLDEIPIPGCDSETNKSKILNVWFGSKVQQQVW
jgi:hypothetical protein